MDFPGHNAPQFDPLSSNSNRPTSTHRMLESNPNNTKTPQFGNFNSLHQPSTSIALNPQSYQSQGPATFTQPSQIRKSSLDTSFSTKKSAQIQHSVTPSQNLESLLSMLNQQSHLTNAKRVSLGRIEEKYQRKIEILVQENEKLGKELQALKENQVDREDYASLNKQLKAKRAEQEGLDFEVEQLDKRIQAMTANFQKLVRLFALVVEKKAE